MGLLVVLAFTAPVSVGLAVVAVRTLEFALNRDIASSKPSLAGRRFSC
jgi:hypothetical protein